MGLFSPQTLMRGALILICDKNRTTTESHTVNTADQFEFVPKFNLYLYCAKSTEIMSGHFTSSGQNLTANT